VAYFPDLTPYRYLTEEPSVLNVGWLDAKHSVETGPTSDQFRGRLAYLTLHGTAAQTRGIHSCELCEEPRNEPCYLVVADDRRLLGSAEVRIAKFAAPSLLLHYVVDHAYRPPAAFIEAVLAQPHSIPSGSWRLTAQAHSRLRQGGEAPAPDAAVPASVDLDRAVEADLVSALQDSVFRPRLSEESFLAVATAHVWDAEVDAPPLKPFQKYLAGAVLQARTGRGGGSTPEMAIRAAISGLFLQLRPEVHTDHGKKDRI
jgi:hypothetical protein